jgi:hypothetical protein
MGVVWRNLGLGMLLLLGCGKTSDHDGGDPAVAGSTGIDPGPDGGGARPEPSPGAAGSRNGGSTLGGAGAGGRQAPGQGGEAEAGAPPDGPCAGVRPLELTSEVGDSSGDGYFDDGETLRVVARVRNPGKLAQTKLRVEADHPGLTLIEGQGVSDFQVNPGEEQTVTLVYERASHVCCGTEVDFHLTVTNQSASDCSEAIVDEHRAVVAYDFSDLTYCDEKRALRMSEPELIDASGDGVVEPGEDFDLELVLRHEGTRDIHTPGVGITPSDSLVVARDGSTPYEGTYFCTSFFVMGAGETRDVSCGMRAEPALQSGSTVHLVLEPRTPFAHCYDMQLLEYSLPIE